MGLNKPLDIFKYDNKLINKQTLMYMIRKLLSLATLLLLLNSMNAQVEKTFFQTYDIKEGIKSISIQSNDSYEFRPWNGVQLMIETSSILNSGNFSLLGILIKEGRYNFDFQQNGDVMVLHPKTMVRPQIKNQEKIYQETIKHIFYIPDEFFLLNKTELVRKEIIFAKNK